MNENEVDFDNIVISPLTESQRQFARDFIFSDAPEEMKQRLGVRPLRFVNQDGKPLDGGIGMEELGRQQAQKREEAALNCILGTTNINASL